VDLNRLKYLHSTLFMLRCILRCHCHFSTLFVLRCHGSDVIGYAKFRNLSLATRILYCVWGENGGKVSRGGGGGWVVCVGTLGVGPYHLREPPPPRPMWKGLKQYSRLERGPPPPPSSPHADSWGVFLPPPPTHVEGCRASCPPPPTREEPRHRGLRMRCIKAGKSGIYSNALTYTNNYRF
jgi:hypothetical protein